MSGRLLCVYIILFLCSSNSYAKKEKTQTVEKATLTSKPLGFKENKGQMLCSDKRPANEVLFKVEQPGLTIWVTNTGLTYQFFTIDKIMPTNTGGSPIINYDSKHEKEKTIHWHRVDMILKDAVIDKENTIKENPFASDERYFLAHCPNGITGVQTFNKITIKNIYKGIDWVLYTSKDGGLKFDFVVHPKADPNQIKLIYEGSGQFTKTPTQLKFTTPLGSVTEGELVCYQHTPENIVKATYLTSKRNKPSYQAAGNISTNIAKENYTLTNEENLFSHQVNIKLGTYNTNETLIIDPQLVWGTLYGGDRVDGFMAIENDDMDNIFITGYSSSSNFMVQSAGTFFQGTFSGGNSYGDIIILKFDNIGNLLWSTYYGGTQDENAHSIAIDNNNNIYITGWTKSSNFPLLNASQPTYGGGSDDAFILKFDNAGNQLWATFHGGSEHDSGNSIAIDNNNNPVITGRTASSANFPLQNPFQAVFGGVQDIFISQLDNLTGALIWSTYYGGNNYDEGNSITVDGSNNIIVVGTTSSTNFQTQNAFQATKGTSSDAFILKINNLGTILLWSTHYGGNGVDRGFGVAVDSNNNVFITGDTRSSSGMPLLDVGTFYQGTFSGGGFSGVGGDAFIAKTSDIGTLLWSSYIGGSDYENFYSYDGIVIDECNNVSIIFETVSSNITTLNPASCNYFDGTFGGGVMTDNFFMQFDNIGNLMWASYIGGNRREKRGALTIDNNNNLFLIGEFTEYTTSSTLPMMDIGGGAYFDNTPEPIIGGLSEDSYILKLVPSITVQLESQTASSTCAPCDGEAIVKITCSSGGPYTYNWSNGTSKISTQDTSDTLTNACAGNYWVEVISNCNNRDTLFFAIAGQGPKVYSQTTTICQGDSLVVGTVKHFTSGIFIDTLQNAAANGCDSIVTTNLTVISPVVFNQSFTECTGFTISVGVNTYSTTGIYNDTLTSLASGCDSIVITNLTVNTPVVTNQSFVECEGFSVTVGVNTYSTTGVFTDVINNCDTTVTDLTINPAPQFTFIKADDNCAEGIGSIAADVLSGEVPIAYNWSTGENDSLIENLPAGTYTLIVTDNNGCTNLDSIQVNDLEIDCDFYLYLPNVFSPNGDGINDLLLVKSKGVKIFALKIYNRWGNVVFKTTNLTQGWDGKHRGVDENTGVFTYALEATFENGNTIQKNGNISLLR